jgi:hypothetical protein
LEFGFVDSVKYHSNGFLYYFVVEIGYTKGSFGRFPWFRNKDSFDGVERECSFFEGIAEVL